MQCKRLFLILNRFITYMVCRAMQLVSQSYENRSINGDAEDVQMKMPSRGIYQAAIRLVLIWGLLHSVRATKVTEPCGELDCKKMEYCMPTEAACLPCSHLCNGDLDWKSAEECDMRCPEWMNTTQVTTSSLRRKVTFDDRHNGHPQLVIIGIIFGIVPTFLLMVAYLCLKRWRRYHHSKILDVEDPTQQIPPIQERNPLNAENDDTVADNTDIDEGSLSLDDVYIPITPEMIWPGAEAFFRNFKVRTEYNFTGTKVSTRDQQQDQQETNSSMSTNNVENRELRPDNQGDCVKLSQLFPYQRQRYEWEGFTEQQKDCIRSLEREPGVVVEDRFKVKVLVRLESGTELSQTEVKRRLMQDGGFMERDIEIILTPKTTNFQSISDSHQKV
ncbi:hypothetical protein CAPTEDRAFT_195709 [Capitella teleta]|uniref:Uncharacterized protein n=1 Tax=Capitella teleta TaxID=283909 RepID=X1ZVE8_CAPTE|nr:hypothetical protein CAPTEDRAFT_195709 [Capitella teleta]|eukprot:ELT88421.1 hypothetical protein CAPTEDRAFT_195709 [Capitella teleta]